jgi:hypothetical protein
MREGIPPVQMLIDEWLVPGELHLLVAEAEAFKTWVALWLALRVMNNAGNVAWFDEELGQAEIAKRLICLGASPDLIEQRFVYFPFPAWERSEEDAESHRVLLRELQHGGLQLVVYDTMTDMLSQAGIDENSGREVTDWIKTFPEEARKLGVTQIILDHKPHGDSKRAVGSRAKRAKAKVEFFLKVQRRGDAMRTGRIVVELQKNTVGAALPDSRTFEIGGGNNQPAGFVFTAVASGDASAGKRSLIDSIRTAVQAHGPVTTRKLVELVEGNTLEITKTAKELALSPHSSGIESVPGRRNAVIYRWVGVAPVPT